MMDRAKMEARLEAIENELWAIEMCDARNKWAENWNRRRVLEAERREIIKALNA
jgi:hypothetical protein